VENKSSDEVATSSTDSTGKDNTQAEKSSTATPVAQRCGPSWSGAIIMSLVVSIAMATLTVWVYDFRYAQKVVSVDIKGFVANQRELLLTGKITEDQFKKSFDYLKSVVDAIPSNRVVLMGDLVVRNVDKIDLEKSNP
jgi:hypothetical protein